MSNLKTVLERFSGVRVLVVGDVMLDRYLIGGAGRISPEAPVPVVNLEQERLISGGAANVAANVAGLGAHVKIISVVGLDEEARQLTKLLEAAGIDAAGMIGSSERSTTVKNRIMAQGQQLVRVDRETSMDLSDEDAGRFISEFENGLQECDVVIISDYGKGTITGVTAPRLITIARNVGIPVFVDPKGSDYSKYKGASALTPNRQEAGEVFIAETRESGTVEEAGKYILENFDIEELVITLGAEGMAVFSNEGGLLEITSTARNVFDVTGAGDTVISVVAVAKSSGADLEMAARIGNTAAGMVVEEVGTTAIKFEELRTLLENEKSSGAPLE